MNNLDSQPTKIAKDLDRHHMLPRSEPSVADCLKVVNRPVVKALYDTVGVRLDPNSRIPDRLESTEFVQPRDPRPEVSVIVFRIDPDAPLWRIEFRIAQ